jgi:hypothetical protein
MDDGDRNFAVEHNSVNLLDKNSNYFYISPHNEMEQMAMFEFLNITKALAKQKRLLITLALLFSFKGEVIIGNPLTILWIAMAVQQPTTG